MGEANTYRHNYPIARVVQVFRNPSDGLVRNVEVTFRGILKKLTHVASLQFLLLGQYGLCMGYCFSGLLPLRSHKGEVNFLEPFPRVPSHLDYTQKSTLALKLSVNTYFHWVTTTDFSTLKFQLHDQS